MYITFNIHITFFMKKSSLFLQAIIVLIGVGALTFMLWEPHLEGRNIGATAFQIYFNDPFLVYAYIASISFFIALYQVFKVLGYVRHNKTFSQITIKALRIINRCAKALIAFIVPPLLYLWIVQPGDDIAGGVAMSLLIIFISTLTAIASSMFEGIVQSGVSSKDLQ